MTENDDEGLSPVKPCPPREILEAVAAMEKRYKRLQTEKLRHSTRVSRTLLEEEEVLRANITRFRLRWNLD